MRKHIEPEYYCDVCGKQVKTKLDLYKVNVAYGRLNGWSWYPYDPIDVCRECREEIADFIKGKMKQKKNAKKEGEE